MNKKKNDKLIIDGKSLTFESLISHIKNQNSIIEIKKTQWEKISKSSIYFSKLTKNNNSCYGINTGVGDLVDININSKHNSELQKRLILSHAIGVGDIVPDFISRLILLLRINCFVNGNSGLRPEIIKNMVSLYNNKAYPIIYNKGSLGASGDLAPLSHLGSFLIGEGYGFLNGEKILAKTIFEILNLKIIKLVNKEGLSIINGTSAMTAIGIFSLQRFILYFEVFLILFCMLIEHFEIPIDFINKKAFLVKNHKGASWIVNYFNEILTIKKNKTKWPLQMPYSFRCVPFIIGPLFDSILSLKNTLFIEANSVNDNPIVIENDSILYHGGHFHGHPVSVSLDQFRIAASHLSGVIDRQLEFLFDRKKNKNISAFMSFHPKKGYCGLEGAQYLVTSLHAENIMLSNPYSVLTISTNAGNQDYVSMGMQSALNTWEMADNIKNILSIYLISVLQIFSLQNKPVIKKKYEDVLYSLNKIHTFPYKDDVMFNTIIDKYASDSLYTNIIELFRNKFSNLPEIKNV